MDRQILRLRVLVIRLGAWGDGIFLSALLPLLKQDGHHVTAYINKRTETVLQNNPHIDKIILHDEEMPIEECEEHWEKVGKDYDKVINLTGSIEGGLLAVEGKPDYKLTKAERHKKFNHNYYDRTLEIGGYPHVKGKNGEVFFSSFENGWARETRIKNLGKFKILWVLSGSSFHKAYPYAEYVGVGFLNKHPDSVIFTVGDDVSALLEWKHPQTRNYCGKLSIRKSLILAKHCDLVIGPETGVINAAGCFDTPKIVFLSHSSEENLTKYWENCTSLHANVPCYPCHRLIYSLDECIPDKQTTAPICTRIEADRVFEAMETYYNKWRESK